MIKSPVNHELRKMWKDEVVAYFDVLSRNFPAGSEYYSCSHTHTFNIFFKSVLCLHIRHIFMNVLRNSASDRSHTLIFIYIYLHTRVFTRLQ
jgi:hypothetical protein